MHFKVRILAVLMLLLTLTRSDAKVPGQMNRRLRCWANVTSSTDCMGILEKQAHAQKNRSLREAGPSRAALGWDQMCVPAPAGASCHHKPLVGHVVLLDVVAAGVFFVTAALALSAGIGGGGIFVPTLALLLRFPPHVAVIKRASNQPATTAYCHSLL